MKAALFLGPVIPAFWMLWSVVSAVPPLISNVRLFAAPRAPAQLVGDVVVEFSWGPRKRLGG